MKGTYPSIKNGTLWDSLSIYARRAEERSRSILVNLNKLSLKISRQSHSATSSSATAQDIGFWEQELQKFERDYSNAMTILYTILVLCIYYPKPIPGQDEGQYVEFIEPDSTTLQFPPFPELPLDNNTEPTTQRHTQHQIATLHRNIATFHDLSIDFYRHRDLCNKGINRLKLFSGYRPEDNLPDDDDEVDDTGNDADGDETTGDMTDASDVDVESGLLNNNNKINKKDKQNYKKQLKKQNQTIKGHLYKESALLDESLYITQNAINNAEAADASLARQGEMFGNILNIIGRTRERFPTIASTIDAIQSRRNRDNLILAALVAFLTFLTVIYLMHKHRL